MKNKKNLFLYSLSIIALLSIDTEAAPGEENQHNSRISKSLNGFFDISVTNIRRSVSSAIQNLTGTVNDSPKAPSNAQHIAPNTTKEVNQSDTSNINLTDSMSQIYKSAEAEYAIDSQVKIENVDNIVKEICQSVKQTTSEQSEKDYLDYDDEGNITQDHTYTKKYEAQMVDFFKLILPESNQEQKGKDSNNTLLQTVISNLTSYKPKKLNNDRLGHYSIDDKPVGFLEYSLEVSINKTHAVLKKKLREFSTNLKNYYNNEPNEPNVPIDAKVYGIINAYGKTYLDEFRKIQANHLTKRRKSTSLYNKILTDEVYGNTGYASFLREHIYIEADRTKSEFKLNFSLSSLQLDECIAQGNEKCKEIISAVIKKLIDDQKKKIKDYQPTAVKNLFNEMFSAEKNNYNEWLKKKINEHPAIFKKKELAEQARVFEIPTSKVTFIIKGLSNIVNWNNKDKEKFLRKSIVKHLDTYIKSRQVETEKMIESNRLITKLSEFFKSTFNKKNINQTFTNTWNTVKNTFKSVWIFK